jgi:hypothetical protein
VVAEKRQSRRPSRLGTPAGTADKPDYPLADDAGFPGLLHRVWQTATVAPDLASAVDTLLTLGGHVPADVQLRALGTAEEVALRVVTGASWRSDGPCPPAPAAGPRPAFVGEIGLTTSGRIVVRVPSQGPLAKELSLVGGVLRMPWSARALSEYRSGLADAAERFAASVADCRRWLDGMGLQRRDELLGELERAARRTAPFVLYHRDRQYTNFRDRNTLTGKTLWPGHPDCALSGLRGLSLDLWSDDDVTVVVCLTLLVRSAGYARIEEANGTQLTLDHVAYLLEETRRQYNRVPVERPVPPAASTRVQELYDLAGALGERRRELAGRVQLYREIHGVLMHKIERIAGPLSDEGDRTERSLCARLGERLPITGATFEELGADLAAAPDWLARPHAGFGTGLESLVYATVAEATGAFGADFAMSRGTRSLPQLIRALRARDWAEITEWDITAFYCCVVPGPEARRLFGGSAARLADTAWSISSRMQYNSWHFIAGNLPRTPEVEARDYFVPPTIPDLAFHSDQHHHGHVAAKVRFSIRSPQPVRVLGRTFNGFVDLRLLRCEGRPFDEQDLLAAHRTSAFLARAAGLAADLAADADIEVTAFDSRWHWRTIGARAEVPQARGERG